MDPRNHQGGYGEAFVAALAAAAGLRLAKPVPDLDGVDFCMWPDRVGRYGGARASPINVQVKSASVATETETHWSYRLEASHFNVLADEDAMVFPIYLFLVIVPKDWRHYAMAKPDGLLLSNAAYWHSVAGAEQMIEDASAKTTVHVPKANLLTVESLRGLVSAPPTASHAQVEAS